MYRITEVMFINALKRNLSVYYEERKGNELIDWLLMLKIYLY